MTTGVRLGANASTTRFARVAETAWGTTPASPSFTNFRFTGETLSPNKTTTTSDEIRADRNVTDEIQTGRTVSGDVNFELSYASYDDIFASMLYSSWSGDTLKNGVAPSSSTFERTLTLPGGGSEYHRFVGMIPNTMNLSITAGQKITGSFGMMGKFGERGSTALSGSTYAAANTNQIMSATADFASLDVTGVSPTPRIRSISLSATNNISDQTEVGTLDAAGLADGRFVLTGNMECYFETGALFQSFLDHDDLALSFIVGSGSGTRYRFTIPTLKLTGNPGANAAGNDQDIILTLGFSAIYDRLTSPGLECALQIERAV